jgi:hypothetical protein
MRTQATPGIVPAAPTVPLLDATFLPAEEDWAVLEGFLPNGAGFDPDDDRFADFGVSAGDFD